MRTNRGEKEQNICLIAPNRKTGAEADTRSFRPRPKPAEARRLATAAFEVGQAAVAFEARWTYAALRRAAPDLAERLNRQTALWWDARPTDDSERIIRMAQAMVRGYSLCTKAMEDQNHPDDAYQVVMTDGGRVYTFGPQACAEYLAEKFPGSIHYTFEAAAEVLDSHSRLVGTALAVFPGAQVLETRVRGEVSDECVTS